MLKLKKCQLFYSNWRTQGKFWKPLCYYIVREVDFAIFAICWWNVNSAPREILLNYIIHNVNLYTLYKFSKFKTPQTSPILKSAKIGPRENKALTVFLLILYFQCVRDVAELYGGCSRLQRTHSRILQPSLFFWISMQ